MFEKIDFSAHKAKANWMAEQRKSSQGIATQSRAGPEEAGQCKARHGTAWRGKAVLEDDRQGLEGQEGQSRSRRGMTNRGGKNRAGRRRTMQGQEGQGSARQCERGGPRWEGLRKDKASRGKAGLGKEGQDRERRGKGMRGGTRKGEEGKPAHCKARQD